MEMDRESEEREGGGNGRQLELENGERYTWC
jgi:hypothetical protein